MNRNVFNSKNLLRLITFLYFIWVFTLGEFRQAYMLWNVFLAWIPFETSCIIYKTFVKNKNNTSMYIIIVICSVIWFLFYPNSPYILTDFIHLENNKYNILISQGSLYTNAKYIFNTDMGIWLDFFNIALGVWIGYMLGFISLFMMHKLVEKRFNGIIAWCFVFIMNILTGFAIYLGRFIRWNSWELIFNPSNILKLLFRDIHAESIKFTALFGLLNLFLYLINYFIFFYSRDAEKRLDNLAI